jgi:hypothetical protein
MGMIFVAFASFLLAESLDSELILFVGTCGSIGLTFLLGVATSLAVYVKLQGTWAVVGLVTGIIATITAMMGSVLPSWALSIESRAASSRPRMPP